MTVKLPADIYSPDQIGIVLWELGQLISHRRDAAIRSSVAPSASDQNEPHVSAFLLGVLHGAGVSAKDLAALEKLQADLEGLRSNAPVAHFLLSALPNRALKRELVSWCRNNLHAAMLMTFATRGDMGGGFIMRIGSKQYDFTYRARLLDDRQRLVELFDNVR